MDCNSDSSPNTKKKVAVRKAENTTSMLDAEERSIPITEDDSTFDFRIIRNSESNSEDEVQIINLEDDEPQAIILLFPHLQSEGMDFEELNRKISTTELTKMLVGKHADFSMLKPSKKLGLPCLNAKLSPIREESSEDRPEATSTSKGAKPKVRYRLDSHDADDECDNCS